MTFEVHCYSPWYYHEPTPVLLTEAEVVAHVARCRNGHAILHDREPYFVVAA